MITKHFTRLVGLFVFLFAVQVAQASTVILLDTTTKSFLPSLVVETRQLCGALPDGERVAIYRLGQGWQAVFDYELSASTRITLGQVFNSTYAVKGQPDWVAALTTASTVARGSGTPRVFVFAPDLSAVAKKGQYRGMSVLDLLNDKKVAPSDINFFIRFIREQPGSVGRENVKLLANAPRWSELLHAPLAAGAPPLPKPSPSTEGTKVPTRVWLYLILIIFAIPVAVIFFVRIARSRRLAGEEGDLGMMARAIDAVPDGESRRENIIHLVERVGSPDEGQTILKEGEELFVGDYYKARPAFAADGCHVALLQRNGVLEIENPSRRAVRIGALDLAPGRRHRVPLAYVEMLIGDEKLAVTRQTQAADDRMMGTASDKLEVLSYVRKLV